jgi:hypothetical protein
VGFATVLDGRVIVKGQEGVGAGRVGDGAGEEERDNEGERDGKREPWAPSNQ